MNMHPNLPVANGLVNNLLNRRPANTRPQDHNSQNRKTYNPPHNNAPKKIPSPQKSKNDPRIIAEIA
jgi:hypothetical protein